MINAYEKLQLTIQYRTSCKTIRRFQYKNARPASLEDFEWISFEDLLGSPESSSQIWHPDLDPSPQYVDLFESLLANENYCHPQACFRNAALAALVIPEVEYAEGLSGHIIPIHHAWNVLPDGTIVDCTWCGEESSVGSPGNEYVGIIVPKNVLHSKVGSGRGMSVFGWPDVEDLLTDPPDWLFA